MNKIIIGVVGVLIVAGGAYAYINNQKEVAMAEQKMIEEEKMLIEKKAMEEKEQMMNQDMMKKDSETSVMEEKSVDTMIKEENMVKIGSYEAYSAEKLARAETGDVVLFFHASWCPSCRGLNTSIENNQKLIPEGVSILKLDYDKETELKKKYGVTTQHTLVQVDKDGNLIKKWSGSGSLEVLLSQIK